MKRFAWVLVVLIAGCWSRSSDQQSRSNPGPQGSSRRETDRAASRFEEYGTPSGTSHGKPAASPVPGGTEYESGSIACGADTDTDSLGGRDSGYRRGAEESRSGSRCREPQPSPVSASPLRAGEVDDNVEFRDYLRYFKAYPDRNVRKFDITDRMVITFTDWQSRPIPFAPVRILAGRDEVYRATTSAAGKVMFPPSASGVSSGTCNFDADVDGRRVSFRRGSEVSVPVDLPQHGWETVDVDVAFCLDTTGSMGDEIDALKRTLRDVVSRLEGFTPRPRLRYGMVTYRDRGDSYVTRVYDFTPDLEEFRRDLAGVEAAGGADYEESVHEALYRSTTELGWNRSAAIRVLFLIGDAPPHTDYSNDYDYGEIVHRAAGDGIKIYTLGASGLNDKGEFVWRQLAQFTMAKFMFISYGGETSHHVGEYRENNLDALMVRAIESEVAALPASERPAPRPVAWGKGRSATDFRDYEELPPVRRSGDRFREYKGR